jgi:hypothetical protein
MSTTAKILSLSYNSAVATKTVALKSHWRSVRLISDGTVINSKEDSKYTNILLNGKCIDPENRNLYVFYIDTFYQASWIIEINIDTRVQTVVYYDKNNNIGFDPLFKIYNPRVVHGRLIWTDNKNPIYQMDIERAKKSFALKIGYGQYPTTVEWSTTVSYGVDQIVSNGNKYYKSLVHSNYGNEPKSDSGANWLDLKCLIEDAYYSMNVKNFYFEPTPPSHPPIVTYQSDDNRKINNLRQTLFQVAYRYVYMDWRKSTFSPASIVPVPQAEEETATGLANEQISLNNKLKITVNSGGEEVRAIEVIGRSSDDPSKWYLIETIDKFSEQERAEEISVTTNAENITMSLTLPAPTVISVNNPSSAVVNMNITPLLPTVVLSYVSSIPAMNWGATAYGYANKSSITIDCAPTTLYLTSFPSWLTIERNGGGSEGSVMSAGMTMVDGEIIYAFPSTENTVVGVARTGYIVMSNTYGDSTSILVQQTGATEPVPVAITCTLQKDPDVVDPDMTISNALANAMSASNVVNLSFRVDNSDYGSGISFTMFWRANIGVLPYGYGSFTVVNSTNNTKTISLGRNISAGETVDVYLSTEDISKSASDYVNTVISALLPVTILSSIEASLVHMIWTAAEYGLSSKQDVIITCLPYNGYLVSKPSWITIMRGTYELVVGMYFNTGDTLYVFPTAENTGSAKPSEAITFGTVVAGLGPLGDTVSVFVEQATGTPPVGTAIDCTVEVDSTEPAGLVMSIGHASSTSGSKNVYMSVYFDPVTGRSNPFTLYWRAKVNGVVQGRSSVSAMYDYYNGTIVLDVTLLAGDIVVIDLATIYI